FPRLDRRDRARLDAHHDRQLLFQPDGSAQHPGKKGVPGAVILGVHAGAARRLELRGAKSESAGVARGRASPRARACLPQSLCAPDAAMLGAHLASSVLTKSAACAGVLPGVGSTPATTSALITLGSASASLIALLSFSTTGCGTPAGARMTFQV